jgi:hypothetical protein
VEEVIGGVRRREGKSEKSVTVVEEDPWEDAMDEDDKEQLELLHKWVDYAESLRCERDDLVAKVNKLESEVANLDRARHGAVCSAAAEMGALRISWMRRLKFEEERLREKGEVLRRESLAVKVEKESFNYWAGVVRKRVAAECRGYYPADKSCDAVLVAGLLASVVMIAVCVYAFL